MESRDLDIDNVTPPSEKRKLQMKRSDSPEPSCVSMKSDRSMNPPHRNLKNGDSFVHRLWDCGVSDEGCAALASALRSNPSHLRELDLTGYEIGDSGKKLLSALKDDEHYKLWELWV